MLCPKCGAINSDNNKECFICNYNLKNAKKYEEKLNNISDLDVIKNINTKNKKKKEKKEISTKSLFIILIIILLLTSMMCIIFGGTIANNKNQIEDILKKDKIISELMKNDTNNNDEIISDDSENLISEQDFTYKDMKYEYYNLKNEKGNGYEIELPEEMEYFNIDKANIYDDEYITDYTHIWKGGYDFDIIRLDILEGYDDLHEAATMFKESAENTLITSGELEGECAYNQIKLEKTIVSGYKAYKVSAYMRTEGEYVVVWLFKADDIDDYIHIVCADVLKEDVTLLEFIDTYKYTGLNSN